MKHWIALVAAFVFACLAYLFLVPLTSVIIVWSGILLERTWASGLSIFIPGLIYFLIAYLWLIRGWLGKWFRRNSRVNVLCA